MHGTPPVSKKVVPLKPSMDASSMEAIILTPERAAELLEHNKINRPLIQIHVERIAHQIAEGKWRFNGDTIKVSTDGDVLDGQHRLWAIVEARQSVRTIVVYGIQRDAFATIDSVRKPRAGSDMLSLMGVKRHRSQISTALSWLIRYQRGILLKYRDPINRIENSDIEEGFNAHPNIVIAVDRVSKLRALLHSNVATVSFMYYLLSNKNETLAERMVSTLENPAAIMMNDPFFMLRSYFTTEYAGMRKKDSVTTIALMTKSINAAFKNESVRSLSWRSQGKTPEAFPTFNF